jgi:uncharacterized membrane protein
MSANKKFWLSMVTFVVILPLYAFYLGSRVEKYYEQQDIENQEQITISH